MKKRTQKALFYLICFFALTVIIYKIVEVTTELNELDRKLEINLIKINSDGKGKTKHYRQKTDSQRTFNNSTDSIHD